MLKENKSAALIIERLIKPSIKHRSEQWLKEIEKHLHKFSGSNRGRSLLLIESENFYLVVIRFRSPETLQMWLTSTERETMFKNVANEFKSSIKRESKDGNGTTVTSEKSSSKPRQYKLFLLMTAAIYGLSLIVPYLLSPLFREFPLLGSPLLAGLIVTSIIAGLMIYLVMPFLTIRLHGWLFEQKEKHDQSTRFFENGTGGENRRNAIRRNYEYRNRDNFSGFDNRQCENRYAKRATRIFRKRGD